MNLKEKAVEWLELQYGGDQPEPDLLADEMAEFASSVIKDMLPSDEDIDLYYISEKHKTNRFAKLDLDNPIQCFYDGIKWMRDNIQEQLKEK